jgi:4-amino-4-deoxy-L-arabinose transferase-like glycosyltransferase
MALAALALLPRLASVAFNAWPHGDVLLDAAIADALLQQGQLKVPLVDVRFYPIDRFGFGYPPDQHPPLWSLLGAAVGLLWRDSYEALKVVSLLAGLALVPAAFFAGRRVFGPETALLAAALCAVSYLLIDFSGNGSLWVLLALLYLLFVHLAADLPALTVRRAILLGAVMAAAYLTNYPAVVLPLAYAACLLLLRFPVLQPPTPDSRLPTPTPAAVPVKPAPWPVLLLPLVVALALVTPWLVYASLTFGSPVWSQPLQRQLGGGDKQVEVVVVGNEVVKRALPARDPLAERLRSTAANLYGNVGFLLRQSFVLLPVLGGFALAGLLWFGRSALRGPPGPFVPLLLLTVAHGALILLWPTTKFRYLVPLLPLLLLLGCGLLWQLQPPALRRLLAGLVLGATALTSLWTYASIPSHTYYYDGGIVTDNFGAQGEIVYVQEQRQLERAAAAIRQDAAQRSGRPAVLGPHPLYRFAGLPLVVDSPAFSPEVARTLVDKYAVGYAVVEPIRLPFFESLRPGGRVLWQEPTLAVYRLP